MGLAVITISILLNLVIGIVVLTRGIQSRTNQYFASFVLFNILLIIADYLSLHQSISGDALFWIRAVMTLATLETLSLFLFVTAFPNNKLRLDKRWLVFVIATTVLMALLTQTPYIFREVISIQPRPQPVIGSAMPIFGVYMAIFYTYIFYSLFKKYLNARGLLQKQLLFLIIGIIGSLSLILVTQFVLVVVFGITNYVVYAPAMALIFSIATFYAIIKHGLFNIKILAIEALLIIVLILLFAQLFLSHMWGQWLTTSSLIIMVGYIGLMMIKRDIVSQDVSYLLRNYHNPSKLDGSPFLKLKNIQQMIDSKDQINALQATIKNAIEYFQSKENKSARTKANLKYHFLRMYTFDQASEGQILYELGFEGFPISILQNQQFDRPPKFQLNSKSTYFARSKNAYNQLKKEAFEDVRWSLEYLDKIRKN